MTILDVLGMLGGFIASFGLLFQVHKTFRERAIKDISMYMLWANIIGIVMVLIYSIGTKQPSIYIPLCLSMGCNLFLITYKIHSLKPVPVPMLELEATNMLEQGEKSSDLVVTEK